MADNNENSKKVDFIIPCSDKNKTPGQFSSENVESADVFAGAHIDASVLNLESESDKGYQKLATEIVHISKNYLNAIRVNKATLREEFSLFFRKLLGWQFVFLILLLLLNSFKPIPFNVSEHILTTYIISVFVETLGAIGVMLAFSFTTREESEIVKILNDIIENYQKYTNSNKTPPAV